jgi:transposase
MFENRMENALPLIRQALKPYRDDLSGIVVESTYNWYWLVDGLMDDGYKVHLANPAAIHQYDGLKFSDDKSDARWLALLLKLGILPEGYIYPKAERPIRDLLRKRSQLVRYRVSNLLSINNLIARNQGFSVTGNRLLQLKEEDIAALMGEDNLTLAANANLAVLHCVDEQIRRIEKVVKDKAKLRPEFKMLKTVPGIGDILALNIALETGDIGRFPTVGDFSSYCRTVKSERISNGKRRAKGTPSAATSISPGPSSKRPISRYGTIQAPGNSTSESRPRGKPWWRGRPCRTSWPGPVTTSCGTASRLTTKGCLRHSA